MTRSELKSTTRSFAESSSTKAGQRGPLENACETIRLSLKLRSNSQAGIAILAPMVVDLQMHQQRSGLVKGCVGGCWLFCYSASVQIIDDVANSK